MGEGSVPVVIGLVVVVIGILLTVILVPLSYESLEYHQYGFKRQKSTGKVDTDKVYSGGLHFIGPDYEFKTFTSVAHFVDFKPLSVFTFQKFEIDVFVYIQYFLRREDLPYLHAKFDVSYDYVIRKSAEAAMKREATNFDTWQFIHERHTVEAAMFRAVRDRLGGTCCQEDCSAWEYACPKDCIPLSKCRPGKDKGLWVDVKFFQLGKVSIDSTVEDKYLNTLLNTEKGDRQQLYQEAQVIRKNNNAKVQAIRNRAKEVRETAHAKAQQIEMVSKANYTVTVEKARSEGLKSLYQRLNIDNEAIKSSFDYLRTMRGLDNVHFTVDFQSRIVGSYK